MCRQCSVLLDQLVANMVSVVSSGITWPVISCALIEREPQQQQGGGRRGVISYLGIICSLPRPGRGFLAQASVVTQSPHSWSRVNVDTARTILAPLISSAPAQCTRPGSVSSDCDLSPELVPQ